MQKILLRYDIKLSKKSSQFTVIISNVEMKDGRWEKVKPEKTFHARDLEYVAGKFPDKALLKLALESEMELRKIEGRFFSPDEEFTALRISSKYLFKFLNQCGRKKVLIDDKGLPVNFKVTSNALLEVKLKENSLDLLAGGHLIDDADFFIRTMPVTYFFKNLIVQLRNSISIDYINKIPKKRELRPEEITRILDSFKEDFEKIKIIEVEKKKVKSVKDKSFVPVLNFGDSLNKAELFFRYKDITVKDTNKKKVILLESKNLEIERDFTKENRFRETLQSQGFLLREKEIKNWFLSAGSVYDVIPVLQKEGFTIKVKDIPLNTDTSVKWKIYSEKKGILVGWKIVSGNFEIEPNELTLALKEKRSFIKRPDGSYGLIGKEIKELLGKMQENGTIIKGFIKFKKSEFSYISELFNDLDKQDTDEEFEELRNFSSTFTSINRYKIDKSLSKILRPYQIFGVNWLRTIFDLGLNGILADDMGLGKTLQVLTLLHMLKKEKKLHGPVLLIVPKTLIYNWEIEINKYTNNLSYYLYTGSKRKNDITFFKKKDIIITTYGLVRNEITLLSCITWDYVILDEAHAIKNPHSLISKAIRKIPSEHRLSLSGTPVENTPTDLWSQFDFLMPGFLYGLKKFKNRYSDGKKNLKELNIKTKPYILRRLKKDVLTELPEKTEIALYCEFKNEQRAIYDKALERAREEIAENSRTFNILPLILKLRQISCHPSLAVSNLNKTITSGKMETVLNNAAGIISGGHKILIFSQFTELLKITRNIFNSKKLKSFYLDGKTKKREKVIEKFQNHKDPCAFFISVKTGGTGLNLTEASYVFLLDPWWNPAVENQAIDRCYRIGQKNPVTIYRFITKNSIEEKVTELKKVKKKMEKSIIEKTDEIPFNDQDLKNLIGDL